MAWRSVRAHPLRSGRYRKSAIRARTYAARSSVLGGSALRLAANTIVDKAKPMAAHLLEASADDIEFEGGHFRVRGTDRSITMVDTAKAFYAPFLPPGVTLGLQATASFDGMIPSYPNGCHVCEVELDPDTGQIRIDRHVVVDDCGRPINPMICEGQIQGGVAQGIGQALMEKSSTTRKRSVALGQLYGLRDAARRRTWASSPRGLQRAMHHQSAWHQGRGRVRYHRCAARGDECRRRRAAQRRRRSHRHAGDASARMAGAGGEV